MSKSLGSPAGTFAIGGALTGSRLGFESMQLPVAEELICEVPHPYPDDLVIATKAGLTSGSRGDWRPLGRPEHLCQQADPNDEAGYATSVDSEEPW
jgi:hypothetical protein